jgi:hypothetical protein
VVPVIAASTSSVQNVEHIFTSVPADGNYELQVRTFSSADVGYAIAWWAGADERNQDPPGDFNSDGKVDSADYVTWRKDPASFGGAGGYDTWQANFGATSGNGSLGSVPEPSASMLFGIAIAILGLRRKYAV